VRIKLMFMNRKSEIISPPDNPIIPKYMSRRKGTFAKVDESTVVEKQFIRGEVIKEHGEFIEVYYEKR